MKTTFCCYREFPNQIPDQLTNTSRLHYQKLTWNLIWTCKNKLRHSFGPSPWNPTKPTIQLPKNMVLSYVFQACFILLHQPEHLKSQKNPTILLMEEILHHLGRFWNLVNNGKNLPTSTGIKSKIHVEHRNTSVGLRWSVSRFTPLTLVIFGPTWLLRLDVCPGTEVDGSMVR